MEKITLYTKRFLSVILGTIVTLISAILIMLAIGGMFWCIAVFEKWIESFEANQIVKGVFAVFVILLIAAGWTLYSFEWAKKTFPKLWSVSRIDGENKHTEPPTGQTTTTLNAYPDLKTDDGRYDF